MSGVKRSGDLVDAELRLVKADKAQRPDGKSNKKNGRVKQTSQKNQLKKKKIE